VKVVYKDFPLASIHANAFKAAEAAHCAGDQGKYWEYHDKLFANQQLLQPDQLKKHAADIGLDAVKFNECLDSSKYRGSVDADLAAGNRIGVSSTPAVFINGRLVNGAQPYENFAAVIDDELQRIGR
jgi:protein-disulfide isomerase